SRAWRLGALAFAAVAILARFALPAASLARPSLAAWSIAVAIAAIALTVPLAASRVRLAPLCALAPPIVPTPIGLWHPAVGGQRRDPFQRPQVERARAVLESVVPAGSLVITSSSLGRPAENISHYTPAQAVYTSELDLIDTTPTAAVIQYRLAGRRVF